tara:strand:+ start:821 stop:1519 length:699 start_codon:yes stop_codon:yes gene_type:complete
MASSFSDLGIELMETGADAGQWGNKTNSNLNLINQAIGGYQAIDVASGDVTLAVTDATISNGRNMTLEFTGTLAANRTVNFPASVEKVFNIIDSTNHANYTLTFKVTSAAGFLLCEGNSYLCHSNGTNIIKDLEFKKWRAITAAETIQAGAQILANTNGGAFALTLPASPNTGDEVSVVDQGYDFNTNALTIGRNSSNIANAAADLVINTQGAGFTLVYSGDATTGWTYKEK